MCCLAEEDTHCLIPAVPPLALDFDQAGHEAQHAEMTSILYVLEQNAIKIVEDAILLPVLDSLPKLN